ncbi:MAG TPA: hypothetical protein VKU83_04525 [Puia sp.]|nr:hypothetical protein [Puia sp.]
MTPISIIVRKNLTLKLHGFSGIAAGQDWAATGKQLMDRMWKEVRGLRLPNKGLNIWVYEPDNCLFTGVELTSAPPENSALEEKMIILTRYARFAHVGPYDTIKASHTIARQEMTRIGIQSALPYIEIYGHHQDDPALQETELIWSIK